MMADDTGYMVLCYGLLSVNTVYNVTNWLLFEFYNTILYCSVISVYCKILIEIEYCNNVILNILPLRDYTTVL